MFVKQLTQTTTQIVSCICNILYFTDNPPLSLKEIISNHTVEPSVQVNCNHLCYKEPKCVGFNFRTKTDAKQPVNCQLTNTTRRKTNRRPGDWTLFYDVDAVRIHRKKSHSYFEKEISVLKFIYYFYRQRMKVKYSSFFKQDRGAYCT